MPTPTEQLLSRTVYATDGSTTNWDFSFASGYLDPSHVKAYTTDSLGARTDIVVTLPMLIGEFQLQITPALAAGLELTIYRDTPKNAPLVDFTDESGFSEISLDTNAKQAVMVAAEAIDTVNATDVQAAIDAAETAATAAANAAISAGTAAASAGAANASAVDAAASAALINPVNFATAAQGAKADTALQPATGVLKTAATGSATIPAGTTAERDVTPAFGYQRANSTSNAMEWWNGSAWASFATGTFAAAGANSDITSLSGLQARGLRFVSGNALDITTAMPSTGSYTAGDIVLESTTAERVSGWKRLTTGSGHVLNTDWRYFSDATTGKVLKVQSFTDNGSQTTSTTAIKLNAVAWNYTPVSTASTLILIVTGNMFTNAYGAASGYCYFYIGENIGSWVTRSAALALVNQQYSTTYGEFIQVSLAIQVALSNTSLATRQFAVMGSSWNAAVSSGVGPNSLTVIEVAN